MANQLERSTWTPQRRTLLVVEILRGRLTVEEAALRNQLDVTEVEDWRRRFRSGEGAEYDPRRRSRLAPPGDDEPGDRDPFRGSGILASVKWPTRPFFWRGRR